jgi:hypothetical protein
LFFSAYSGDEPSSPDPDQWRFSTRIAKIRASYYERWTSTDERQVQFFLYRAYLHLYLRKREHEEDQIFALHCDPNESQSNKHFRYKAGPHVHLSATQYPIDRAHIALNNPNLATVLGSVGDLTYALEIAVKMIDDQILEFYGARE